MMKLSDDVKDVFLTEDEVSGVVFDARDSAALRPEPDGRLGEARDFGGLCDADKFLGVGVEPLLNPDEALVELLKFQQDSCLCSHSE